MERSDSTLRDLASALNGVRFRLVVEQPAESPRAPLSPRAPAQESEHHGRLLLRVAEAAEALAVSRSTLYVLVRSGQIPVVRLGKSVRISVRSLEAWIAAQSRE